MRRGGEILAIDAKSSEAGTLLKRIEEVREEKVAALVARGDKAISLEDFPEAAQQAQEVLKLHPAAATSLLRRILQAMEERRKEQASIALAEARRAQAQDPQDADQWAQDELRPASDKREARSVLKQTKKEQRARKKEQRRLDRKMEKSARVQQSDPHDPSKLDPTRILTRGPRIRPGIVRRGLWIAGVVLVAAVLAASVVWRRESVHPSTIDDMLAAAKTSFDQKDFDKTIEIAQQILQMPGENQQAKAQAQAFLSEASTGKTQKRINRLLLEAQILRSQSRLDDSRVLLQEVLHLDPTNDSALATLSEIDNQVAATRTGNESEEEEVNRLVATARRAIESGKMEEAAVQIKRIEDLPTKNPAVRSLKAQYDKKASELEQREQRENIEAGKRSQAEEVKRQALELFRQGKYSDVLGVTQNWLALVPGNSDAIELRNRVVEVERQLKTYHSAMNEKNYGEASNALGRLAQVNSGDPNLSALREQLESRKAAARASLTVLSLDDGGELTLDGRPFGTNGESKNESVQIGRQKLVVRLKTGLQHSIDIDPREETNETYVYDKTGIRRFNESDREILARRDLIQRVSRVDVEHDHRIRGKCAGKLLISGIRVEYRAIEGDHSFSEPFQSVTAKREGEKLVLKLNNGKEITLKALNANAAVEAERHWLQLRNSVR
jgi:tetratricopeptide (TPR) repeat protein